MKSEPLDESYLKWLYSQVANPRARNPQRTYWKLLRTLFTTEFVWLVPNDDNRVEDGRFLREEFLSELDISNAPEDWLSLGCSFLEMAVGLSRRLCFEAERTSEWWFWKLMENLGLHDCTDATDISETEIDHRLSTVVWRTYNRNGQGGLFPLQRSRQDQRKVEIWYQMQTYLLDNRYV